MAQSLRVALACPEPRYVDTPFQFRNRTQTSEANSTALRWRGFRQMACRFCLNRMLSSTSARSAKTTPGSGLHATGA